MRAFFSDKFLSQRRESVTSQQDKRRNSATHKKTDHRTTTKRHWPRAGTYSHVCPHPWQLAPWTFTTPCVSSHEESGATLHHARARVGSRTQLAQLECGNINTPSRFEPCNTWLRSVLQFKILHLGLPDCTSGSFGCMHPGHLALSTRETSSGLGH